MTGLDALEDRLGHYPSHELGRCKTADGGGLELLSWIHPPDTILFVDDRGSKVAAAAQRGMRVLHYRRDPAIPLAQAIRPSLPELRQKPAPGTIAPAYP